MPEGTERYQYIHKLFKFSLSLPLASKTEMTPLVNFYSPVSRKKVRANQHSHVYDFVLFEKKLGLCQDLPVAWPGRVSLIMRVQQQRVPTS
jgi:hypothetical protein